MPQSRRPARATQPPIDPRKPFDPTPHYIVGSSAPYGWQGVSAWHQQSPSVEMVVPPITHYAVILQLVPGPILVQERDGRHYAGRMGQGDAVLIQVGQPSTWQTDGDVDTVHIDLEPGFVQQIALETCNLHAGHVTLVDQFHMQDPVVAHLGRLLVAELHTAPPHDPMYAEGLGTALTVHLLQHYGTHQPVVRHYQSGLSKRNWQQVQQHIAAHLAEPLTLGDLAKEVSMDRYHFLRAFKRSAGSTPYRYLLQCRIARARVLLKTTRRPITEIAGEVGFRTPSQFTSHFHRLTGQTPSAYRRAVQ